jgi:CheY-like chemotaxis protein
VEDNPDGREALRILLEIWGYTVEAAGNGLEGVRKAITWHPDAAVVDIGLPLLDGYEVARRLKNLDNHILLVALTAYGRPEDRRLAFQAGFNHHLTKPAEPEELHRLLDGCCSSATSA